MKEPADAANATIQNGISERCDSRPPVRAKVSPSTAQPKSTARTPYCETKISMSLMPENAAVPFWRKHADRRSH